MRHRVTACLPVSTGPIGKPGGPHAAPPKPRPAIGPAASSGGEQGGEQLDRLGFLASGKRLDPHRAEPGERNGNKVSGNQFGARRAKIYEMLTEVSRVALCG